MKPLVQEFVCQVKTIDLDYERKIVTFTLQPNHRPNGPGVIRVAGELMPEVSMAVVLIDDPDRDHFIAYVYPFTDGGYARGDMRECKVPRGAA